MRIWRSWGGSCGRWRRASASDFRGFWQFRFLAADFADYADSACDLALAPGDQECWLVLLDFIFVLRRFAA